MATGLRVTPILYGWERAGDTVVRGRREPRSEVLMNCRWVLNHRFALLTNGTAVGLREEDTPDCDNATCEGWRHLVFVWAHLRGTLALYRGELP